MKTLEESLHIGGQPLVSPSLRTHLSLIESMVLIGQNGSIKRVMFSPCYFLFSSATGSASWRVVRHKFLCTMWRKFSIANRGRTWGKSGVSGWQMQCFPGSGIALWPSLVGCQVLFFQYFFASVSGMSNSTHVRFDRPFFPMCHLASFSGGSSINPSMSLIVAVTRRRPLWQQTLP